MTMGPFVADSETVIILFTSYQSCMMCNKVQFTNRLSTVVNVFKAYLQRKKKLMSSYKGYKEETVYENRTMN